MELEWINQRFVLLRRGYEGREDKRLVRVADAVEGL
jgi:hypothetical protein